MVPLAEHVDVEPPLPIFARSLALYAIRERVPSALAMRMPLPVPAKLAAVTVVLAVPKAI